MSYSRHVTFKGWDEGHMLRRILDVPVPGKRPEKYRKPGGKTRVKEICKV